MSDPLEIWKEIPDCNYSISTLGRIKNTKNNHIRCADLNSAGYERLKYIHAGKPVRKFIHRLVAMTFLDNPLNKPMVDHIDGNYRNNRLDNLRWATRSENALNGKVRKDKKYTTLRNIVKNGKHFRWRICIEGRIHTSPNFSTEQEAHLDFLSKCNNLTNFLRVQINNL